MNAAAVTNDSLSEVNVQPGTSRRLGLRSQLSALVLLAATLSCANAADVAPLPAFGADLQHTSVSGLSSGAFMAAQFDVAWSSHLIGAGIVAGGAFDCAGESEFIAPAVAAVTLCMQPAGDAPSAAGAWRAAQRFAKAGQIDDPANLREQRIYLFSGAKDTVVATRVVDQAERFYELAQVPKASIEYQRNPDAGHALITNRPEDSPCDANKNPFINNCGFEQAHEILRWIYARPNAPLNAPAALAGGQLQRFDQREFDPDRHASMADVAYAYVPAECLHAACAVHVAFHGCVQSADAVGQRFVRGAGYNEIADTNRLIVLYPQVEKSAVNPLGCWDFWGYTSPDPDHPNFNTREAPQMAAVMRMIERLGGARQ
ncbi:poly(3-hydroxybutyrate) depolymerase [Paraburkholderia sp. IMGN_8]|uniref:extracellular catalytic domain type 2 short-chain-length polyhydroxyalkanoate depolymerase n=1 Tax=Paraburkholderia sp. IMGN_8 TaxID=3136564 RepID=UPI00310150BC